jgi:hypothetical protein
MPSCSTYHVFQQQFTDADLKEVVEHIGGNEHDGVKLLARHLHDLNPQAALEGMRDGGSKRISGRLSTEQSLMFMDASHLSGAGLNTLGALLKFTLGYDILAMQADVKRFKNMYATALQHFIYPGVEKSPGHFDPAPCTYWVKDVFEVVSNRLRLDRDNNKLRPSGITSFRWLQCDDGELLEQVTYISVVISCDGGGGSFKVAATIAVRESDHCTGLEEIEWANCAEEQAILSKAVLPTINDFLLKLKKESVLFAWIPGTNAWDFVFISAEITTSHENQLLWDEDNERVCYRFESAPDSGVYMQKSFEKLSRADLSRGIKLQIIAIKLRLVCDLKCMCMLQNRPFLSGTQCGFCGKCASDWEPSYERSISDFLLFTSSDHKNWKAQIINADTCGLGLSSI